MNLQEFSEHIGKPENEILEVVGFKANYTARDVAAMSRKNRKAAARSSRQSDNNKTGNDQPDDTSMLRHGVASSIAVTGLADGAQDAAAYMEGYTQGLKEVYSVFRTGQISENPVIAEGQIRLLDQMKRLNDALITKKPEPFFFSDSSKLLRAVEDYEMEPDEEERKLLMSVLHSFRQTSLAIQGDSKSPSLPSSLPAQTKELGTEPTWEQTADYQG